MQQYTAAEQYELVKKLAAQGWEFKWYGRTAGGGESGWWVLPSAEDAIKRMRRGDPQPFYQAAITAWELYAQ